MNSFTLLQRIRNKIKLRDNVFLKINSTAKIVGCQFYIKGKNNSIEIHRDSIIRNSVIEIIGDNCHLKISEGCHIGGNCYFSIKDCTTLSIGSNVSLSRNTKIMTSDGHPIFQNGIRINNSKNISIGNNVWIADNVTILKGVQIGENCVVGINSTVTKDVPKNSIAAGNPAIIIKENIRWKS